MLYYIKSTKALFIMKNKLKYSAVFCAIFAVAALIISVAKDGKEGLLYFTAFLFFGALGILCIYIRSTAKPRKILKGDMSY